MTKFTTSLGLGLLIVSSGAAMAEQRTVILAVDNMYSMSRDNCAGLHREAQRSRQYFVEFRPR
jgi:hypothetical protein